LSPDAITLPLFSYNDIKRIIQDDTLLLCQSERNKVTTKLNEVKNSVQPSLFPPNTSRKHETAITRLRIGHTFLTHFRLMNIEDPIICKCCGVPLTVKHILIECRIYKMEREKYQMSDHLAEILNPEPTKFPQTHSVPCRNPTTEENIKYTIFHYIYLFISFSMYIYIFLTHKLNCKLYLKCKCFL